MTKFVGAEYVIACTLIELKSKGIDTIGVGDLYNYGIQMQNYSIKENVDVVFLTAIPYVESAIFDFSDYFSVNRDIDGSIESIGIVQNKEIVDLEQRFVGNIPLNIMDVIDQVLKNVA